MPLATKNGSLIIKDGKLAENCNCCGGWYCCASSQCLSDPSSITVTISASDWYSNCTMHHSPYGVPNEYQSSGLFLGNMLTSPLSLTKSPSTPIGYSSQWSGSYATQRAGCTIAVPVSVLLAGSSNAVSVLVDIAPLYLFYVSPTDVKSPNDIACNIAAYQGGRTSGLIIRRNSYQFSGGVQCYSPGTPMYSKTWSADLPGLAGNPPIFNDAPASTFYVSAPIRDADGVVVGGDKLGQGKSVNTVTGSPSITLTLDAVI